MTEKETSEWLDDLSKPENREKLVQILQEYYTLRNHICERVIGVPTGAADWIKRAVHRAHKLRDIEHSYRRLVRSVTDAVEESTWTTKETICTNCMGRGLVNGDSCCCCSGTGARHI